MTCEEILLELQAHASEKHKANVIKMGIPEECCIGVSTADVRILAIEQLISDVHSWDLCDHLCKNLIIKVKDYEMFIFKWVTSVQTYKKRAAFTLIASSVIHNKAITDDTLEDYLRLIQDYSDSEHEHIKKAVSWALREIGKKDFTYNEKAVLLARELKNAGNKAQVWIAKDALKELENLVKAEGRRRLISTDTQMGCVQDISVR